MSTPKGNLTAMPQHGFTGATSQSAAPKERKIKMVVDNWFVFEEGELIWLSHFCSGKPSPDGQKRAPWFHKGENVDKTDKCSSCDEEIPKNLLMMAKVNNVKYA